MNTLKITSEHTQSYTTVSNLFIDEYMPKAQGDYVKIYLYLLRLMQSDRQVTTSDIADHFDITEKDLCRALRYWIKEDVLRLVYNGKLLVGITLLPLKESGQTITHNDPFANMAEFQYALDEQKRTELQHPLEETSVTSKTVHKRSAIETAATEAVYQIPKKRELTPADLTALTSNQEFSQLLYLLETYLGKAITQNECKTLAYIYDDLGFSTALLEYLIEFCVMNNKKSVRYMEKVAINWYSEGITDVEAAKEATLNYNTLYSSVLKALGIVRRAATGIEINYIDTWHQQMGFDTPIIIEACKRAMLQKPKDANFPYVNGILESWHKANVHTLSDINQLDKNFYNTKKKPVRASASVTADAQASNTAGTSDDVLDQLNQLFMEETNRGVS